MSKKTCFRGSTDKQHSKPAHTLLKSASPNLYHIHWSMPSQFSQKKSLLLTCKILVLLVNTLAANEKYPVLNRGNLTIPIQKQLSEKQKKFSEFFRAFLKCRLNFKHFQKKDVRQKFCIFEITDSVISKKSRFRGPFDKQHGKRAQTLLKSAWKEIYETH